MLENEFWIFQRTCSRVSSGTCNSCQQQCYHGGWHRKLKNSSRETLCDDCYLKQYFPEAHAARIAAIKTAEEERLRLVANPPPGSIQTEDGALLGPKQDLIAGGIVFKDYRQVLQGGLFDRETISSEIPDHFRFFSFKKESDEKHPS